MNFLNKSEPKLQDNDLNMTVKFDVEPKALLRIVCAIAFVIAVVKLFNFMMVFLLGLMLAVTFEPLVIKLVAWGCNRKLAIFFVAAGVIGIAVLFSYIILPSIYEQLSQLVTDFPEIKNDFLAKIPDDSAFKKSATQALSSSKMPELTSVVSGAFPYLHLGLEAFAQTVLIFIFSIYLLIDGKRALKWFSDFFTASVRLKLRRTSLETAPIVHRYILGQLITSAASAIYTFTVLTTLKVPAALTLACLAGVLDILPVLGFVIAVVPAILLALTVNPFSAFLVLIAYILYHAIESYLLTPLIYGTSLKISSLVVLASLIVAGSLGGVLCAIAILPIVASYPIIEKIWLVKYLGHDVIRKHENENVDTPIPEQVMLWEKHNSVRAKPEGALSGPDLRHSFRRKIMLVEDDSDIRAVLQDILETEGYLVVAASNGREGLELIGKNQDVGLVILDSSMPIMSGTEFLKHLRTDKKFAKVPVIYLTGEDKFNTLDGVSGVLKKPSEMNAVIDMVEKFYS